MPIVRTALRYLRIAAIIGLAGGFFTHLVTAYFGFPQPILIVVMGLSAIVLAAILLGGIIGDVFSMGRSSVGQLLKQRNQGRPNAAE